MAYVGKTYAIPYDNSGLQPNPNTDQAAPESFAVTTRNLNRHQKSAETRGGTVKEHATPTTGTPDWLTLYDFRLKSGTSFQMRHGTDGKLWKSRTDSIKTSLSEVNWGTMETFDDELYFADGASVVQTWDGAAAGTSNITTPATDWSGSNQPRILLNHGRGLSQRLWACGVPGNLESLYYSTLSNGKEFSGGTSGVIQIETADGFGIVGLVEMGKELIAFGKRKAYRIDDSDATHTNWGIIPAQWEGGAAHHRLIVKTPTDVVCMTEDGDIYSIQAVNAYGDYHAASLTRPSTMHRWIKENVKLSEVDKFHAVYDPTLRAVIFFVMLNSGTTVDTALLYFIDAAPENAWMIHDNQSYVSGYRCRASALVRVSVGVYEIWTGGYGGYVWRLNQETISDDGNPYYSGFKSPALHLGLPRIRKHFKRLYVVADAQGDYNMNVRAWIDEEQVMDVISLAGAGGALDDFELDVDVLGGNEFIERYIDIGGSGRRLQYELYTNGVGEKFRVSQVLIDFKPQTVRP